MNTWGLTLVNLGFGIFILLANNTPVFEYRWNSAISSVVAFIGIHSYSIYLWHVNLLHFTEKIFPQPSVLNSFIFCFSYNSSLTLQITGLLNFAPSL